MKAQLSPADRREVERLFRDHSEDLFRYSMKLARRDSPKASDLVQEAFQVLVVKWGERKRFSDDENRRWLFTVARNKAVDRWREEQKLAPMGDADMNSFAANADPGTVLLNTAQLNRCWKEIEQMPARRHRIAVLVWIDGRTPNEVASLLSISSSTVRVQIKLARDQIKKALAVSSPMRETDASHAEGGQQ